MSQARAQNLNSEPSYAQLKIRYLPENSMEKPIDMIIVIIDIGSSLTLHSDKKPITPISMVTMAIVIKSAQIGLGMKTRATQNMQNIANVSLVIVDDKITLS